MSVNALVVHYRLNTVTMETDVVYQALFVVYQVGWTNRVLIYAVLENSQYQVNIKY